MPGLSKFMSVVSEEGFSGAGITGAVVAIGEEPAAEEAKPPNLINVAILLIGFSFVVSLLAVRTINKQSKYRT
ncbi:MAG: hypothetical protein U9R34_04075 [Nanoarchaeota archaeon]|nr:hypothetical protein [Nanoarchaeota archaeon]